MLTCNCQTLSISMWMDVSEAKCFDFESYKCVFHSGCPFLAFNGNKFITRSLKNMIPLNFYAQCHSHVQIQQIIWNILTFLRKYLQISNIIAKTHELWWVWHLADSMFLSLIRHFTRYFETFGRSRFDIFMRKT